MERAEFKVFRCGMAGIDAVEAATQRVFPRHTHEQFGIGLLHRGAQRSLSGRGMVEAGAGDIITVNPGELHDGAPIGGSRSWRILYFDPSLIAAAAADIGEGKTGIYEFPRPVMRDRAAAIRFASLFALMTGGGGAPSALRGEELFLLLLRGVMRERQEPAGKPSAPNAVFAAKRLIDDDPAAPITLADLAKLAGLSRFQLLRGFARATGFTPHAYLVQRRIALVRRLIAQGTPLAEAAVAGGFADQSHMTRVFVRNYGLSPGAYAVAAT